MKIKIAKLIVLIVKAVIGIFSITCLVSAAMLPFEGFEKKSSFQSILAGLGAAGLFYLLIFVIIWAFETAKEE